MDSSLVKWLTSCAALLCALGALTPACANFGFPSGGPDEPDPPPKMATGYCAFFETTLTKKSGTHTFRLGDLAEATASGINASCDGVPTVGGIPWWTDLATTRILSVRVESEVPLHAWAVEVEGDECLESPLACSAPTQIPTGQGGASAQMFATEFEFSHEFVRSNTPRNIAIQLGSTELNLDPDSLVTATLTVSREPL